MHSDHKPSNPMGEKMRILTDCSFLSQKQIEKIEKKYNAKYVLVAAQVKKQ